MNDYRAIKQDDRLVCIDCKFLVLTCSCLNNEIRKIFDRLTDLEKNDHTHAGDNTITRLENLRNGLLTLDDRVAILEKAAFRNPATMPTVYDLVNNVFILNDGFYPSVDGKLSNQPLGKSGQFWNVKTNQWEDQPFGSKPAQPMESASGSPLESLLQDKINERDKEVERLDQTFKFLMQNYELVLNDRNGLKEQFIGMGRLVDDLKHSVTALNNEKEVMEKQYGELNNLMAETIAQRNFLSHQIDDVTRNYQIKLESLSKRKCPRCTCTYDEAVCAIEN
jgi:nitrogen fixation-related uncharacterized protein